jgi:UDP-glucose 4-epimerase
MNWLITGGCGFIGTNLVARLMSDERHAVRVVDNLSVGTRDDLRSVAPAAVDVDPAYVRPFETGAVHLLEGSILDEDLARAAASGADVIVHLAGNTGVQPSVKDPRADCVANVIGTLNYLEAARHEHVGRFIFASSGGTVIGDVEPPIHEELVPHPKSPYGASKSACEGYLSAYHGTFGIDTVALRFGNVYGPRSSHKSSVVANFVRRAIEGKQLEIYGDGQQTRDFIFVEDLLDAIEASATREGAGGKVFQIATGAETTVNAIADVLVDVLVEAGVERPSVLHAAPLSGEIRRNFSDTTRAQSILDWRSRTSLKDGLRQTVAWFVDSLGA